MQGYREYPKTVPKLDCGRGLGRPRPFSKVQVGGIMRSLKILPTALALSAMPLGATAQQLEGTNQVVDRIVAQERAEVQLLRQYAPLVETYIQYLLPDKEKEAVPNGDRYFLGRAELARGLELEPLEREAGLKRKLLGGLRVKRSEEHTSELQSLTQIVCRRL